MNFIQNKRNCQISLLKIIVPSHEVSGCVHIYLECLDECIYHKANW